MRSATLHTTPFFIEVDGVRVEVLEVLRNELISGDVWYRVVVCISYGGVRSQRYSLMVRDIKDLVNKLKIEITKVKFIHYAYGLDHAREVIM